MLNSNLVHGALIFGLTFVLEDVAVLGAALLVVNSMVSLGWAAGSSFAGIWLGDLGLYFLALRFGRPVLDQTWFRKLTGKVDLRRSESWFQSHGTAAILLSRAIPGTRLPTYVAAGLLKVPAGSFVTFTAAACLAWVAVLFWLSYHIGMAVISGFEMFRSEAGKVAACAVVAAAVAWPLRKTIHKISLATPTAGFRKLLPWEFWPPMLFYLPVAVKYLQLSLKYRSAALPTLANPGMQTGGLIGESKFATLAELWRRHPGYVAETYLIPVEPVASQMNRFEHLRHDKALEYPLVLKPDVGQRGFGFRIVHSDAETRSYLELFRRDTLLQRYAPGPYEAGILHYRFPGEDKGKIFAITDKVFPVLVGDGRQTLEELIHSDERASVVAGIYLKRFSGERHRVLAPGESFRLVEAGNHCQGAIFLDGQRLFSRELEETIDLISRSLPGFFVGRYDVRYASEADLRQGRNFQIIELNGASSEATSIYDPRNSLTNAYRTLFRQWEIVFAIGDRNRRLGLRPTSMRAVLKSWNDYRVHAALHPVSD